VALILEVAKKGSFFLGVRCRAQLFIDDSLDDVVVLTDACNLGTKDVGRSIESGDVNWDDHMDVQKGSSHFSNFFKDDVVGGGWWRKAKDEKNEERSNRVHFYFYYFFYVFFFLFPGCGFFRKALEQSFH